jgi:outer membrane protein
VKSLRFVLTALAALSTALPSFAQTNGKVAVINIQSALVSTKDGQKAANDITSRFNPKKAEFEKRQNDINQLQDQLNRGRNTLSDEARQNLMREIDQKTKSLKYDTEDAQSELTQEEQKIMGELFGRLRAVVDKYAKDNGYVLVLDDSSQQTMVYASSSIDITRDIIELYDKNSPGASAPASSSATPPVRPPVTAKPATPSK